ncbi:MAG: VTT domain-containing protein [Caulobacteraceae bacterium]
MNSRGWRRGVLAFVLFGALGLALVFGARLAGLDPREAARQWLVAARGPWALPLAVAAFAGLAFLGAPQFVLIAAAVVVFGPVRGMAYSWIGTMVSALVGFWLGRGFGVAILGALRGPAIDRFMGLVARNGFAASLLVRLAPLAPFVVVNVTAGMSAIAVADFAAGTAIGIVPKIALVGLAGGEGVRAFRGGGATPVLVGVAALLLWVAAGLAAGRWLRRRS